ncbi:HAD family hydrolase [Leucobacter sp. BZR 635]
MTSHVYFDFFGTLVDYDPSVLPDTANAPYDFAARAGAGISGAHASELWQRAWTELDTAAHASGRECSMLDIAGRYAELLGQAGFAIPSGGLDRLVSEYLEAWTTNIRLAAGVTDCLTDLARDHTLSVVSNTHDAGLVPRMLRRFGIADYFTNVFTSVELGWRKPHPEIFAAVLAEDAITADQAAFVGDNWEADVEGPQAAGMRAFYVGIPAPGRAPVEFCALPDLIRG